MKEKPQTHSDPRFPSWLMDVPKHWSKLPNRAVFRERIERGFVNEQMLAVTIKEGIKTQEEFLANSSKKDASNLDKSNYKLVEIGDLVYNKMRMWQGAIGYSEYRGLVSPAYVVLTPRADINPRFYHYLLRTPLGTVSSYRWSYGICDDMLSLRFEDFKQIQTVVPPREEQDAIVAFLDRKLEEIDRFIANKRRLIELQEEEFEFQLACLITSGNTRTEKSKKIEFVEKGTVNDNSWTYISPNDWNRKRLKFISSINPSKSKTVGTNPPKAVSFVPMELANAKSPDFEGVDRLYDEVESGFTSFQDGDVLIAKITPCFENGKGGVCQNLTNGVGFGTTEFHVLRPTELVTKEFLYYATITRPFRQLGESQMQGSAGQQRVPTDFLKEFVLPFPSVTQQKEIVRLIKKRHNQLIETREYSLREIELMEEFRTSLIAEAVTGRIDVRGGAA